jgi:hypothetical protein
MAETLAGDDGDSDDGDNDGGKRKSATERRAEG